MRAGRKAGRVVAVVVSFGGSKRETETDFYWRNQPWCTPSSSKPIIWGMA